MPQDQPRSSRKTTIQLHCMKLVSKKFSQNANIQHFAVTLAFSFELHLLQPACLPPESRRIKSTRLS